MTTLLSAVPARFRPYLAGRRGFYAFLGAAAAFEVAKGFLKQPTLTSLERSYWFVNYDEGFTRRGLGGAAMRAATGSVPTVLQIETVAWIISAIALALLARLVILAVRSNTESLDLAAIALCCSPFVIPFILQQRRPDELGIVVFLAYGLALHRFPEHSLLLSGVAGLALATAVFSQEAVFLECLPWVGVITLLAAARERWSARIASQLVMALAPGAAAAAISAFFGRLDAPHVQALTKLAAVRYPWVYPPADNSVFLYLGDSLRETAHRVLSVHSLTFIVGSAGATIVVFAVQAALMSGFRRPRFAQIDRGLAIALRVALLSTVVSLIATMMIGLDSARWMTNYFFYATATIVLGLLYVGKPGAQERRNIPTRPLILATGYLLLLWPIDDWFDIAHGVRFLLFFPK